MEPWAVTSILKCEWARIACARYTLGLWLEHLPEITVPISNFLAVIKAKE